MRRIIPLFFLIPLIILAPIVPHFGDQLIYPAQGEFSDLTITHWPAFAYARDQIVATGQIPMWRTSILSGTPLSSDPLSGLFYPPHWLALVLPLPIAFNLLMFLHLALAAAAMYLLMRRWNLSPNASIASAIAYAAAPKIIAHMGVGHVTLVEAWAWLPLVLVGMHSSEKDSLELHGAVNRLLLSGLALAMCLLADVRMAIYAALLAITYLGVQRARRDRMAWAKIISRVAVLIVVAVTVSAVVWLPALTLTGSTARASLTPEEAGVQSLDPAYLLGVIIADRSGAAERMTYLGSVVLILAMAGIKLFHRRERRLIGWLIGVLIVGAIVALGLNTPFYRLLYGLPGSTLLRVPARAWFVVTFAAAALAGFGLQAFMDWTGKANPRSIFVFIVVAFAAFVCGVVGALGSGSLSFIAIALWIPIATFLIFLRLTGKLSVNRFVIASLALVVIDLISIDWALYRPSPIDQVFEDGQAASEWLAQQPGVFRIYSPSYSIPQQVAQEFQLQLADGIDPLQLSRYVAFMQKATGVGAWDYSVTLPAFPNLKQDSDIRSALSQVTPDVQLLGLLNVKYIVSAFPIEQVDLIERAHLSSGYIYENLRVRPRAFVMTQVEAMSDQPAAARWLDTHDALEAAVAEGLPQSIAVPLPPQVASIGSARPDRIEIHAAGPGLLVLSEVFAPDWIATIDDQPAQIFPTDLTLRGVVLPPGDHTIVFTYQPTRVYIGALISIMSLLVCGTVLVIRKINQRNK